MEEKKIKEEALKTDIDRDIEKFPFVVGEDRDWVILSFRRREGSQVTSDEFFLSRKSAKRLKRHLKLILKGKAPLAKYERKAIREAL